MLAPALEVGEALDATVVNMRFAKPLDGDTIVKMAESHDLLVTIDENSIPGGAGSAVNERLAENNFLIPVLNIGLPDRFIEHGEREDMLVDAGLDAAGLETSIRAFLDTHAADAKVS